MKNYQEQTDMERLLTKLSTAMLDDKGENDIHRMFHNAKGSNDAVEAVYELIMNLVAYKEAAMKDMKERGMSISQRIGQHVKHPIPR
jgi:hypothetical protein